MDTPGKALKTARENQGKSLKDISVNLKLGTEYLTAIEEDDYSQLPAEVFTKAYLRLYADELGLDGDYIMRLYHDFGKDEIKEKNARSEHTSALLPSKIIRSALNAVNTSGVKIKSSLQLVPASLRKLKDSIHMPPGLPGKLKPSGNRDFAFIKRAIPSLNSRTYLLVGAAVIAVVFVAMMLRDTDTSVLNKPVESVKQVDPREISIDDKKQASSVEEINGQSKRKKKRVKDKISGKLVLEIIADELTWASVRIDGGQNRESHLRAGEAFTVRANEKFNLKIGNAGGTRLVLNGRDLGNLGPRGKVVNITLP